MNKNFVTGFVTGGIICAAVTGFAVEYAVTANPYPVKVNGVETTIQGYNINDETYFKLRDVSAAVGGFEVGFENNAIIVNTPNKPTPAPTPAPTSTSAPVSSVKPTPNPKLEQSTLEYLATLKNQEYTSDGVPIDDSYQDGKRYVNKHYIKVIYDFEQYGYEFVTNYIRDKQHNKVLSDILLSYNNDIELTYYETVLRPWLQEHCK